jgi:carboxyl-terminal processing protease
MQKGIEKPILAVIAAVVVLVFGIWWGGHPGDLPPFLRNAFVTNAPDTSVDEAIATIRGQDFRPVPLSRLTNAAIGGLIASLHDPYATYYTPAQFKSFEHPAAQHFIGIGVYVVAEPRGVLIDGVIPDSPASRGGLEVGDVVVSVDGHALAGRSATYSTDVFHGKTGTLATLRVARGGRTKTVVLRRARINLQLVTGAIDIEHGVRIGVIELPTFDVIGIHTQVAKTLKQLLRRGAKGIVLDLRDNGGGLVNEAQLVASLFIARGKIVTTRGRSQPTVTLYATGDPLDPKQPMAVLVNGDTASSAEIVSGALQDDHRATIVGTHTYGKGVFQQLIELDNGGAIGFTVGEYFLPNGTNLGAGGLRRGRGVIPNVIVTAQPSGTSDPALAAALRIVAADVR